MTLISFLLQAVLFPKRITILLFWHRLIPSKNTHHLRVQKIFFHFTSPPQKDPRSDLMERSKHLIELFFTSKSKFSKFLPQPPNNNPPFDMAVLGKGGGKRGGAPATSSPPTKPSTLDLKWETSGCCNYMKLVMRFG